MTHITRLTDRARAELQSTHDWWAENRSALQAELWYDRFVSMQESVAADPERFALASENLPTSYVVREAHFGLGRRATHRILFTLKRNVVVILSVRHASQQQLTIDELSLEDPAP